MPWRLQAPVGGCMPTTACARTRRFGGRALLTQLEDEANPPTTFAPRVQCSAGAGLRARLYWWLVPAATRQKALVRTCVLLLLAERFDLRPPG